MAEQSSVNCISRPESTEAKFVKKDFSRAFSSRKDIYIYRVSLIKQYANIEEGGGGPF